MAIEKYQFWLKNSRKKWNSYFHICTWALCVGMTVFSYVLSSYQVNGWRYIKFSQPNRFYADCVVRCVAFRSHMAVRWVNLIISDGLRKQLGDFNSATITRQTNDSRTADNYFHATYAKHTRHQLNLKVFIIIYFINTLYLVLFAGIKTRVWKWRDCIPIILLLSVTGKCQLQLGISMLQRDSIAFVSLINSLCTMSRLTRDATV